MAFLYNLICISWTHVYINESFNKFPHILPLCAMLWFNIDHICNLLKDWWSYLLVNILKRCDWPWWIRAKIFLHLWVCHHFLKPNLKCISMKDQKRLKIKMRIEMTCIRKQKVSRSSIIFAWLQKKPWSLNEDEEEMLVLCALAKYVHKSKVH